MIKNWIASFFFFVTSISSYAQETEKINKPFRKNAISYSVLGTSVAVGVSYERFISNRISAELGVGLVGVGVGIKYFYSTVKIKKILINTGLTFAASPLFNTTDVRIIEGEGFLLYVPFGLSYFGKKRLNLGVDIGPATTFIKNYNGSYIIVYGNLKIGFRF